MGHTGVSEHAAEQGATGRVRALGLMSWYALGVIALVAVVFAGLGSISGIVVPLLVAIIISMLFAPMVDWLGARGLPRGLAALLTLLVVFALLAALVWIVVSGFVQQIPDIAAQLLAGMVQLRRWLRTLDIDPGWIDAAQRMGGDLVPALGTGVAGVVGSTFSGAASFVVGAFFAAFFLFFALRDAPAFPAWAARNLPVSEDLAHALAADAAYSMRGYFRGTAITAIATSTVVLVPLVALGVPLIIPIMLLYFITSFIPFVGAFIAGGFAVIIAFGSGGAQTALIILVAVLISNGSVQSAVSSWALGSSLDLHPMTVLLATVVGGTVAGILGMVLGAPLLAVAARVTTRLRAERSPQPAT